MKSFANLISLLTLYVINYFYENDDFIFERKM